MLSQSRIKTLNYASCTELVRMRISLFTSLSGGSDLTSQNPEISGFQLRMCINKNPNGLQKAGKARIEMNLSWPVTSLLR